VAGRRSLGLIGALTTPAKAARRGLLVGLAVVVSILLADTAVLALRHQRVSVPLGIEHAAAVMAAAPAPAPFVVASLPVPPAAPAPDLSPGWEQRRGAEALGRIMYPWQRLGYSIVFAGARPGLLGGTIPEQHRIILFVRPDEDVGVLAAVVAHEIGHAIDKSYNNDSRRRAWLEARGLPSTTPWFTCYACPDFTTGSGDFAESFAAWQTGSQYFHGRLAPAPSASQLTALQRYFSP
jgi:hypothetical protein